MEVILTQLMLRHELQWYSNTSALPLQKSITNFYIFQVRFFNSQNTLANFTEHTRTLRLYPRPVVAFQINSFLRSRPRASNFLNKFARTQAVEFLAEWSLTPTNVAFLRIQTGVLDPIQIGDKSKWFAHTLTPIRFSVWDDGSSMNGALRLLQQMDRQATDESGSDSEGGESTSSSYSSLSDFVSEMVSSDLSPSIHDVFGAHYHHNVPQVRRNYVIYAMDSTIICSFQTMSSNLDPKLVYHPPTNLQFPEGVVPSSKEEVERADSPQSTSSSRSDLSSPSFNRDSEFEYPPKDKLAHPQATHAEKDISRDTIGATIPAPTTASSFENESDSNSTTTAKTVVSGQTSAEAKGKTTVRQF